MKRIEIITIFMLTSCLSLNHKNSNNNIYSESFKLISKDLNSKSILVSDIVYFQNSSDFAKMGAYTPEMEKNVERLEKEDKKNYFEPYQNTELYREVNYHKPASYNGNPIAFFSKPKNDSLIVEVFKEYQNSFSIKDYSLTESKVYLFGKVGDSVKILKTFTKRR